MKTRKLIFWIATIFLFIFEGMMPLGTLIFAPEYFNAGTRPLGYPDYFAYALIICKILGAFVIVLPQAPLKLREWAYAGMFFNLIFAFISHAAVDQILSYMLMPLVIIAVLALSYFNQKQVLRT